MAKFDWGFTIANKETATTDGFVEVHCEQSHAIAKFALTNNAHYIDGYCFESNMTANREQAAEIFLSTMGWI